MSPWLHHVVHPGAATDKIWFPEFKITASENFEKEIKTHEG